MENSVALAELREESGLMQSLTVASTENLLSLCAMVNSTVEVYHKGSD